jgi:hypothetical protein
MNRIFNTIFDLSFVVLKSIISLISSSHTIPIKISVFRFFGARSICIAHASSARLIDYLIEEEKKAIFLFLKTDCVLQFHLEKHLQLIVAHQHQDH